MWTSRPLTEIDPGLLELGELHLWLMPLAQPASVVEQLAKTLAPDETERAARFHFDRDRRRFIAARGLLRQILGRYSGVRSEDIRFAYGPFDKPCLAAGTGPAGLEFSLSHSQDWALVGFARGRMIGVDLEEVRPMADYRDLAQANFAPAEVTALFDLPEEQQLDGFFACWTRKEAYAKALGLGLSLDLSSFAVSVRPSEGAETIPPTQTAGPIQLRYFRPTEGFWGAVAIESSTARPDLPQIRFSTLIVTEN